MKKALIIIAIIALLAAAYAVVVMFGTERDAVSTTEVEQVSVDGVGTDQSKNPFSGTGTLAELQKQGKDLECQVVMEREGGERVEGTYFTSGGSLRGDFMVPAPEFGGTVLSSMIVGGDSMYVWSKIGEDTFGFRSTITDDKARPVDAKEPVPLDASVKYTCSEWVMVDGSVFVPPAEVKFQDLNTVIEAGMEYGTVPARGEF